MERQITGSRRKSFLYLVGSLVFVGVAATLAYHGNTDWPIRLGLVLFGLCALVFTWLLVRPQQLILDEVGFTVAGGLVRTPRLTRWDDIDGFFLYRLPRGGKMIGYNYTVGFGRRTALQDMNRRFGADGALSKGWPGSPERIVEELNAFRGQALARRRP